MRGLYAAGMIVLYTTATSSEQKKRRLISTIPSDRILDVDELDQESADALLSEKIVGWIEGLRIVRPEENR